MRTNVVQWIHNGGIEILWWPLVSNILPLSRELLEIQSLSPYAELPREVHRCKSTKMFARRIRFHGACVELKPVPGTIVCELGNDKLIS